MKVALLVPFAQTAQALIALIHVKGPNGYLLEVEASHIGLGHHIFRLFALLKYRLKLDVLAIVQRFHVQNQTTILKVHLTIVFSFVIHF